MEQYEKRDSSFRISMHDLSVDKGGALEADKSFAAIGDPAVEMETSYDGFCLGFADH